MLSPRRKGEKCGAIKEAILFNSVTTRIENVDDEISDECNSHATSIASNIASLRYIWCGLNLFNIIIALYRFISVDIEFEITLLTPTWKL